MLPVADVVACDILVLEPLVVCNEPTEETPLYEINVARIAVAVPADVTEIVFDPVGVESILNTVKCW